MNTDLQNALLNVSLNEEEVKVHVSEQTGAEASAPLSP